MGEIHSRRRYQGGEPRNEIKRAADVTLKDESNPSGSDKFILTAPNLSMGEYNAHLRVVKNGTDITLTTKTINNVAIPVNFWVTQSNNFVFDATQNRINSTTDASGFDYSMLTTNVELAPGNHSIPITVQIQRTTAGPGAYDFRFIATIGGIGVQTELLVEDITI